MSPTSTLTQARTKARPPKTSPTMAMILHPCSRLQPQQQVETLILVSSSSLYKFWNGNRDSIFNQVSLRVARTRFSDVALPPESGGWRRKLKNSNSSGTCVKWRKCWGGGQRVTEQRSPSNDSASQMHFTFRLEFAMHHFIHSSPSPLRRSPGGDGRKCILQFSSYSINGWCKSVMPTLDMYTINNFSLSRTVISLLLCLIPRKIHAICQEMGYMKSINRRQYYSSPQHCSCPWCLRLPCLPVYLPPCPGLDLWGCLSSEVILEDQ